MDLPGKRRFSRDVRAEVLSPKVLMTRPAKIPSRLSPLPPLPLPPRALPPPPLPPPPPPSPLSSFSLQRTGEWKTKL